VRGHTIREEEAEEEPGKKQAADERIRSLANELEPFLSGGMTITSAKLGVIDDTERRHGKSTTSDP
jgi:hypothetical protein